MTKRKSKKSGNTLWITIVIAVAFGLNGCALAVVPLIAAGVAGLGYSGYKTIQLASGGSVKVGFLGEDGKPVPPQSLPPANRVAVWPGDESDVMFANTLEDLGQLEVEPPDRIKQILAKLGISSNINMITDNERNKAFNDICRSTHSDLVFAARPLGTQAKEHAFSLSRPTVTSSADVMVFSCRKNHLISQSKLAVVVGAPSEAWRFLPGESPGRVRDQGDFSEGLTTHPYRVLRL